MSDYETEAKSDAKEMVFNFLDEIVEQIVDGKEVSDDVNNDYPDGDAYHHETHIDKSYTLSEAADCLDELAQYEETDKGLWEGCEPRRAIEVQAAFTYGAAVWSFWTDLIKEINTEDWTVHVKGKSAVKDKERVKKAVEDLINSTDY